MSSSATRWYFWTVLGSVLGNVGTGVFLVLGPLMCVQHYGGVRTWATVSAVGGLGSMAGGFLALRFRPRFPLRAVEPLAAMLGLLMIGFALRLPVPTLCVIAVLGFSGNLVFNVGLSAYPRGLALAGPLARVAGTQAMPGSAGALQIVGSLAVLAVPCVWSLRAEPPLPRDRGTPAVRAPGNRGHFSRLVVGRVSHR